MMNDIAIRWQSDIGLDYDQLLPLLHVFGDLLPNPLSKRLDLTAYARKLLANAEIAYALIDGKIVGLLGMYANNRATKRAHIPFVSVSADKRGIGIGKALVSRAVARARQSGMRAIDLEVSAENKTAQQLYLSFGFRFEGQPGNRCTMLCDLPGVVTCSAVTPLEEHPRLSALLGLDIDLRIKRDDLYPMAGGGIKARKIEYIMRDMITHGQDVIVTNGGPQSNHARASAVLAATLGIKCHLVIVLEPGIAYQNTGNILLMRMSGATIEFCSKNQLAERMDSAMNFYAARGHNPLYVCGGGHCLAGTVAFVEAAEEAQTQCRTWKPEFVVLASGTGTTQAGLAIGCAPHSTHVIGVSVTRDAVRGGQIVRDCVSEHNDHFGKPPCHVDVDFRDEWTDGGYERTSPELLEIIDLAAKAGVFVDPTYSGKALRGLVELAKQGEIPRGSRVLFWHTGGLMNIQASQLAGDVFAL